MQTCSDSFFVTSAAFFASSSAFFLALSNNPILFAYPMIEPLGLKNFACSCLKKNKSGKRDFSVPGLVYFLVRLVLVFPNIAFQYPKYLKHTFIKSTRSNLWATLPKEIL